MPLITPCPPLGLSKALSPWHKPLAVHNPGKIAMDLAISVAVGGDCAGDISVMRAEPGVFADLGSDSVAADHHAGR